LHPGRRATLQAAVDRLTRAITTAADDAIPELVAERRALREELREQREAKAPVPSLAEGRMGRKR